MDTAWAHASEIAAAVSDGRASATAVVGGALARIAKNDRALNAFTAVTEERALAKAAAIDAERARGRRLGVLAGVPFAVKNLFDVAGLPTLAGSKINRDHPPAQADATLIARLEAAGAVLGGARAGADRARLRHQRLDPGAGLAVRLVRPQADLWPPVPGAHLPVRGQ